MIQTIGSSYVWTITGGTITFGQGQNIVHVTWGDEGVGTLTVYEVSSVGCTGDTVDLTVDIQPNFIGETPQYGSLTVFPNPFSESAQIVLPTNYHGDYSLQLTDLTGRVVCSESGAGSGTVALAGSELAKGVYLLRVEADRSYLQRVVVE